VVFGPVTGPKPEPGFHAKVRMPRYQTLHESPSIPLDDVRRAQAFHLLKRSASVTHELGCLALSRSLLCSSASPQEDLSIASFPNFFLEPLFFCFFFFSFRPTVSWDGAYYDVTAFLFFFLLFSSLLCSILEAGLHFQFLKTFFLFLFLARDLGSFLVCCEVRRTGSPERPKISKKYKSRCQVWRSHSAVAVSRSANMTSRFTSLDYVS